LTSTHVAAGGKAAVSGTEYLVITLGETGDVPAIEKQEQDADGVDRDHYGYTAGDDPATIWRNNRAYWVIKPQRLKGISHVLFAHDGFVVGAAYLFGSQGSRTACQAGKTVLSGSPAASHELIGKAVPPRAKSSKNPVNFRTWSETLEEWVA
jgi:hypothetical protein